VKTDQTVNPEKFKPARSKLGRQTIYRAFNPLFPSDKPFPAEPNGVFGLREGDNPATALAGPDPDGRRPLPARGMGPVEDPAICSR
jgi:hypothetical protein